MYTKTSSFQHHRHQAFANVVEIALYRADDDDAPQLCGIRR